MKIHPMYVRRTVRRLVGAGFLFFAICQVSGVHAQKVSQPDDREAILRLNEELSNAFSRRDREALNRILAPEVRWHRHGLDN